MSVGIEDADDIIADLDQAMNTDKFSKIPNVNSSNKQINDIYNPYTANSLDKNENNIGFMQFDGQELLKQMQNQFVNADNIDKDKNIKMDDKTDDKQKGMKVEL